MLEPIKPKKIYTIIVNQIQKLIEEKQLKPGDKLPSERDLASSLSVSRTSVRQALETLSSKGIITIKRGDGSYISETKEEKNEGFQQSLIEVLSSSLAIHQINPVEIAEARRLVESEIARLCALHADSSITDQLKDILKQEKLVSKDNQYGHQILNTKLHQLVAEGSRNKVFKIFMDSFIELMNGNLWYWGKENSIDIKKYQKENWEQHEMLVLAICDRRAEDAKQIMYDHLSLVVNEMKLIFAHEE